MILRELISVLGFEIDSGPLKEVEEKMHQFMESVESLSFTLAAAGGILFGFAKFTAEAGEQAYNTSLKIGMSIESFQAFSLGAKGAGMSADDLQTSFRFLNRHLSDAALGGKEAGKVLARAGLNLSDFGGRMPTTEEALMKLADRFETMPGGIHKTALAVEIFGRSGMNMIPFLKKGSAGLLEMKERAEHLGGILDEDTAKGAISFNEALHETMFMLKGLVYTIGGPLMKEFEPLIKEFNELVVANRKFLALDLTTFMKTVANYFKRMGGFAKQLMVSIHGLGQVFGGFNNILKMTAIAMGVMQAFKTLSTLGSAGVAAVEALSGAYKGLSLSAAIANGTVAIMPALIGLGIVAFGLMIEDLVAYFQGRDSIFGRMIAGFQGVANVLNPILNPIKDIIQEISNEFSTNWPRVFIKLGEILVNTVLTPLRTTLSMIGWLTSRKAPELSKVAYDMSKNTTAQGLSDKIAKILPVLSTDSTAKGLANTSTDLTPTGSLNITPTSAPVNNSSVMNREGNTANVSPTFNMTFGNNVSAEETMKTLEKGVSGGMSGSLRQANETLKPKVSY